MKARAEYTENGVEWIVELSESKLGWNTFDAAGNLCWDEVEFETEKEAFQAFIELSRPMDE